MNRAILVREKVGRLVSLLTDKSIKVTQRGSQAFCKFDMSGRPILVNVPFIPDDADDLYLNAIEGFLDHEVAHVLYTDYKALAKAKELKIERLHNIIEDSFIERKMASNFTGSGLNLSNVGEFFLKSYTDKQLAEHPENAVGLLMVPAVRALAGQAIFRDYMNDKWHLLESVMKKIKGYAEEALPKVSTSFEALDVAIKIKELLSLPQEEGGDSGDDGEGEGKPSSEGEKSESSSEEGESDDEGDDSEAEEGGESEEGDSDDSEDGDEGAESESDGESESEGEGGDAESEGEGGDGAVKDAETEESKESTGSDKVPETDHEGEGGKVKSADGWEDLEKALTDDYDEKIAEELSKLSAAETKESDYKVWSTEFDLIEPMKTHGDVSDSLKNLQDEVDHMVGPLQKDMERAIAARSKSVWSAGHRSGRLHAAALSRLTMFNDDRAFRRKHESTTKDVAVSLLIDCSGSMSGSKIHTAASAAYALASVLDRLNISSEVLGFTTKRGFPAEMHEESRKLEVRYSRHMSLYIPIFKSFNERMNTETKGRFAALGEADWLSENVDGESVAIAASRLSQRRESRKVLIVLSDGQPACPGDVAALNKHLKKTVAEIERSGIDVLGIGIQSAAPAKFYSKHVVLNNVADLPTTVIGQIKRILMRS